MSNTQGIKKMFKKYWFLFLLLPLISISFGIFTKKSNQCSEKKLDQPQPIKSELSIESKKTTVVIQKPKKETPKEVTIVKKEKKEASRKKEKSDCQEKKIIQPVLVKTDAPIEPQQSTNAIKKITFNNTINKDKLGYRHWGIWYYPSKFILSINGTPIENGTTKEINLASDNMTVRFDYEFLNGLRKGWREVIYMVDSSSASCNIDFNWKDNWQIIIDKAKPVSFTYKNF